MPMRFKKDILAELKERGYSTYKLRCDKLLASSTMTKLKANYPVDWSVIESICALLECQPGDILEFGPDSSNK